MRNLVYIKSLLISDRSLCLQQTLVLLLTLSCIEVVASEPGKPILDSGCCGSFIIDPEYRLEAWCIGPDPFAHTKSGILQTAAAVLQKERVSVQLQVTFSYEDLDVYRKSFKTRYSQGGAPDIISEEQDEIIRLAKAGKIVPLDQYLRTASWQDQLRSFSQESLETVAFESKLWAIPFEQRMSVLFYRKDILRKLGVPDDYLADLLLHKRLHEVLDEIVRLSYQAKSREFVKWGLLRSDEGDDYGLLSLMMFGFDLNESGGYKRLKDQKAIKDIFDFHHVLIKQDLCPGDIANWEPEKKTEAFARGDVLFWIGASTMLWPKLVTTQFPHTDSQYSEEQLSELVGVVPMPSVKGPIVPVKVHAFGISSQGDHPEIAIRILEKATTLFPLSRHVAHTYTGSVREDVLAMKEIRSRYFLMDILQLRRYAQFLPGNSEASRLGRLVSQSIEGVERGDLIPEQAFGRVLSQMKIERVN